MVERKKKLDGRGETENESVKRQNGEGEMGERVEGQSKQGQ